MLVYKICSEFQNLKAFRVILMCTANMVANINNLRLLKELNNNTAIILIVIIDLWQSLHN